MKRIPFSIPVSGVIVINGESVSITVNQAEIKIATDSEPLSGGRLIIKPAKPLYDIILEAAREVVKRKEYNRFTSPELYAIASEKYKGLNKGSITSRIIACTRNHPSNKYHSSGRDYFSRIAPGTFKLNDQYTEEKDLNKVNSFSRPQ